MDCRTCQDQFPERSVELLPPQVEAAFDEHLKKCPPCKQDFLLFEEVQLLVSRVPQPLPSNDESLQMWSVCVQRINAKSAVQSANSKTSWLDWGRGSSPLAVQIDRAIATPAPWLGFMRSPTLGWATLGGALLVLGSVWWFTPQDNGGQYFAEEQNPGTLVQFQQPPAIASDMVNHHAAMGLDPFADRVGSTMVSYSATSARP